MSKEKLVPNLDLMWVQLAAYGDAYGGYDRDNVRYPTLKHGACVKCMPSTFPQD